mmetsp:Transcript_24110/g.43561  ORF Transcript_24110/g.43561 Transcript_24110/m.43561 type:complete len:91 (-) Transcript_24110:1401-1673(-)
MNYSALSSSSRLRCSSLSLAPFVSLTRAYLLFNIFSSIPRYPQNKVFLHDPNWNNFHVALVFWFPASSLNCRVVFFFIVIILDEYVHEAF